MRDESPYVWYGRSSDLDERAEGRGLLQPVLRLVCHRERTRAANLSAAVNGDALFARSAAIVAAVAVHGGGHVAGSYAYEAVNERRAQIRSDDVRLGIADVADADLNLQRSRLERGRQRNDDLTALRENEMRLRLRGGAYTRRGGECIGRRRCRIGNRAECVSYGRMALKNLDRHFGPGHCRVIPLIDGIHEQPGRGFAVGNETAEHCNLDRNCRAGAEHRGGLRLTAQSVCADCRRDDRVGARPQQHAEVFELRGTIFRNRHASQVARCNDLAVHAQFHARAVDRLHGHFRRRS